MSRGTLTALQMWQQYRDEAVVRKSEQFATFTLGSTMVDPLNVSNQTVQHDFQSVGALLTNNLTAKLVASLFPSGVPFFKNMPSKSLLAAAVEKSINEQEVNNMLARLDREATERLFVQATTAKLTRLLKLLIITGNALAYRDPKTGKMTVWSIRSYVVRRAADGEFRHVVLKQIMRFDELPEHVQADYTAKKPGQYKPDRMMDYFTVIEKKPGAVNKRVVVWNEIDGQRVGPESSYPEHLAPWIVTVWNLADGEHYGRGLVEDFTGDFAKVSLVSEQLGLYELEALSLLNVVDESAGGVIDEYQESDTGDYVRGKTAAITSYERGDYNKINAVRESIGEVIQRLSMAFMYTGNTRQAERVTAEEIRAVAKEAESTLGGVYSLLAETLQGPLAYLCMADVADDLMMGLVTKQYKPVILTGIPALSRAVEMQNLLAATQEIAAIVPALTQLDTRVDGSKVADLIYNSRSVDVSRIFKEPEVIAAEAEAKAQAAAQAQEGAQAAMLGAGATVNEGIEGLTQ